MRITNFLAFATILALAACSGGGISPIPDGTPIETDQIESYVTNHNGYTRARVTPATSAADAIILAEFDRTGKSAGFENIMRNVALPARMELEVIAEMTDGQPTRILRITADQAKFAGIDQREPLMADAEGNYVYHFRADAMVFVTVGDDPMMISRADTAAQTGVVNIFADINKQTVSIDFSTGKNASIGSTIETSFNAVDLPFNVATGTYGGDIEMTIGREGETIFHTANGQLRGNIAANRDELANYRETMTTSGVFTASGNNVSVEGLLWGRHPNK